MWCKLAPSPIHGIGVFAIRSIPKGQRVYCVPDNEGTKEWLEAEDFTGLHDEIFKLIKQRHPLAIKGAPFLSPNDDARLISFMNHSNTPNYDFRTDRVVRDIKAGEEITEDFGELADSFLPVDSGLTEK